ncbi:MAG TPA: hypothetical protein VF254_07710 [Gammaproteobacteria bacterium]
MRIERHHLNAVTRVLYTAGILVSLATFILHAIPLNWGIFLTSACFIVGGMLWGVRRPEKPDQGRES